MQLERTCWAGLEVSCPPDWEVSHLSGKSFSGQIILSERVYQRLEITWRPLKHPPDIRLTMERFRSKTTSQAQLRELSTSARNWLGMVATGDDGGCVVRAGRYFSDSKVLVELTLGWPKGRDKQLEAEVLGSIDIQKAKTVKRRWQAMGISVDIPGEFDIAVTSFKVGRIAWTFHTARFFTPILIIERLAAPSEWLGGRLAEWLKDQLPPRTKVVSEEQIECNRHGGCEIISRKRAGLGYALIGLARVGVERAWVCPAENRLYRLSYCKVSRSRLQKMSLPDNFKIRCCKAMPSPAGANRDKKNKG